MKIIELLNKIANGEEVPKKIKFCLRTFAFIECDYICLDSNTDLGNCNGLSIHKWIYSNNLNDEVEIIEEEKEIEKIEKIEKLSIGLNDYNLIINGSIMLSDKEEVLVEKINELIDVINDMRDKECINKD